MLNVRVVMIGTAIVAAASAAAQDGPAPVTSCTVTTAQATTIADIIGSPNTAIGRCVAVEGLAIGNQLHADNVARYRPQTRYNDPSSTGAIIGLYGARQSDVRPQRVRIVGRLGTCADLLARAQRASTPDSIVMLGGYCHYFSGATIDAVTVTAHGDADQVRMPRGRADPALGNIAPMAAGPARDRLMQAAVGLFAGLGTVDVYRSILRPNNGPPRSDAEINALATRLATGAGTRSGDGVTEIFGWRTPLWAGAEERAGFARQSEQVTEGIACHSIRPDAAALWPISDSDAFIGGQRPYACARISVDAAGTPLIEVFGEADEDYDIREP
jgi:hypothetical protein